MKTPIFFVVTFLLIACGGGSSEDSSELLGTWKGEFFLTSNNCPYEAYDTYEATLTVNQDFERTIVNEETVSEGERILTGVSAPDSESIEVTQQVSESCVASNSQLLDETVVIFRSIKMTPAADGRADVYRSQTISGCSDLDCQREWRGSFHR